MKKRIIAQRKSTETEGVVAPSVNSKMAKGESMNLTKTDASLDKIVFACGWDAPEKDENGVNFDMDFSLMMLDKDGKLLERSTKSIIFFNNLKSPDGSIVHMGDALNGTNKGDDDTVYIDLTKIPVDCKEIVGFITIYQAKARKQHLGQIKELYARLYKREDEVEICKFSIIGEEDKYSLTIARLYNVDDNWSFEAMGDYSKAIDLNDISARYQ